MEVSNLSATINQSIAEQRQDSSSIKFTVQNASSDYLCAVELPVSDSHKLIFNLSSKTIALLTLNANFKMLKVYPPNTFCCPSTAKKV